MIDDFSAGIRRVVRVRANRRFDKRMSVPRYVVIDVIRDGPRTMRESLEISEEEFVEACRIVVTVLAGNLWNSDRTTGPPAKRSKVATSAAMDCVSAAKHCGFGRTRFRELVAEGVFPEPVTIEGMKRWLVKDLDASLLQIARKQRSRK